MSRRKSSYRSSSSGKGFAGLITAVVALVLAVALTITAAFGSSGFTNPDFKSWFNYWGKGAPAAEAGPDEVTLSNVLISKEDSDLMKVQVLSISAADYEEYSVPETAEAGYTLNVTLGGDYVEPAVHAVMRWKVEESTNNNNHFSHNTPSWHSRKDTRDYAKFVQTEVGGHEFVLSALQPYGTPIELTIYLTENPQVKCTVQLDYLKRFTWDGEITPDRDIEHFEGDDSYMIWCNVPWEDGGNYIGNLYSRESLEIQLDWVDYGLTLGLGTVDPDWCDMQVTFKTNCLGGYYNSILKDYNFKSVTYHQALTNAQPALGWRSDSVDDYIDHGFANDDELCFTLSDFLDGNYSEAQIDRYLKLCHYAYDYDITRYEGGAWSDITITLKTYYKQNLYSISDSRKFQLELCDFGRVVEDYEYDLPYLDPSSGHVIL